MSELASSSADQTEQIAATFASGLAAGDIVLIEGGIGAGKTTFVRGACRGLGVTVPVTSPTFTIGRVYPVDDAAPVPEISSVAHLDLYRIGEPGAEEPGFFDEYAAPDRVTFVEWPGGGLELPADRRVHTVRIELGGLDGSSSETDRVLSFT